MSSILKVDQIQLADGSTPTAGDLGLNQAGTVLQTANTMTALKTGHNTGSNTTFSNTYLTVSLTPKQIGSKLIGHYSFRYGNTGSGGNNARIKVSQSGSDTFIYLSGGSSSGDPNNPLTNVAAVSTVPQMMMSMTSGFELTTTSLDPITFTIQLAADYGTLYCNSRNDGEADCTSIGYITVQEIAG